MENEVNNIELEEVERKYKAKKRFRGFLIALNAILLAYLVFDMGTLIYQKINSSYNDDSYISLYNSSKRDSNMMYDTYLLKENDQYITTDIFDYGIYGDYLHLSTSRIDVSSYSSIDSLYLRKVKPLNGKVDIAYDSKSNKTIDKAHLDGGLRLSNIEEGDYLLFDEYIIESNFNEKHKAFKIRSEELILETIYTLPNQNGIRKKVDVKSIDSSPCLVISVNEVKELPASYYDFVFIGEDIDDYISSIDKRYKVYHAKTLLDAYQASSSYCFSLEDVDGVIGSNYLNNPSIIPGEIYGGESIIKNQDKNDYIRELGGYLTSSGSMIEEEETSFITAPYKNNKQGKYTLIFKKEVEFTNILEIIK